MEEKLLELINQIQLATPEIWDIAARQVQVNLVIDFLATIVLLTLFIFGVIKSTQLIREADDIDRDLIYFIMSIVLLADLLLIFASLQSVITCLLNPQYKAIQILLNLIPK